MTKCYMDYKLIQWNTNYFITHVWFTMNFCWIVRIMKKFVNEFIHNPIFTIKDRNLGDFVINHEVS